MLHTPVEKDNGEGFCETWDIRPTAPQMDLCHALRPGSVASQTHSHLRQDVVDVRHHAAAVAQRVARFHPVPHQICIWLVVRRRAQVGRRKHLRGRSMAKSVRCLPLEVASFGYPATGNV